MKKTYFQIVIISLLSLFGIFYAYTNYLTSFSSDTIQNEKYYASPEKVQNGINEKLVYITKIIEKNICNETKKNETASNVTTSSSPATIVDKYDYFRRYPFFKSCKTNYSFWPDAADSNYDFSRSAPNSTHDFRLTRAVLVYFPIEKISEYELEFRWFYRSWIEMQKYEPTKWRTDLIVFIDNEPEVFKNEKLFFKELNCSFDFKRTNSEQKPMCSLFEYKTLKKRSIKAQSEVFNQLKSQKETYEYLLSKLDIFSNDSNNLAPFYKLLYDNLSNYGYLDSILMAFDGYDYFKSAGFDFLIRSDMDVFLTPLFGTWIPRYCNEFYCGRGAYSTNFNMNRLNRIASNLNLKFGNVRNLGSTWYSTPNQFRLVSYLTLFGMAYLNQEEFSSTEREGKLGVLMWPEWHYGVLLLYGQNLAMNHLIGSNQLNVVKLEQHIDFPSGNLESVHKMIHIHVFHGDDMFSKFQFKAGRYDKMEIPSKENASMVKHYALKMALEAKKSEPKALYQLFADEASRKI